MTARTGITGIAVRSGAARTPDQFAAMLRAGTPAFHLVGPDEPPVLRGLSRACGLAVRVALEALAMAGLSDPACAVVVAGSNIGQAAAYAAGEKFRAQPAYTPVRHGYEVFDTHLASAVAEAAGLRGPGLSVGGASASGNSALIAAADLVALARAPACIVVAAPPDFSPVEWAALDAMGVLLPKGAVCRPLDARGAGFAPGEACAAVVVEGIDAARLRGAVVLAEIAGAGMTMDGMRGAAPNAEGEAQAMRLALGTLPPGALGVISAHATGTPAGDMAECRAIETVLGDAAAKVPVNAPKSLAGHAIQGAALIEVVALVLQMQQGFLHGTAGLEQPVHPALHLLRPGVVDTGVEWALNNAFGFGGINTSVLLRHGDAA